MASKLPKLKDHCQMCGRRTVGDPLAIGLNPSRKLLTLCSECREGSMLLLAARKPDGDLLNSLSECMNTMQTLSEYLQEAHESELQSNHGGDGRAGCSYCDAIKEASTVYKGLLKTWVNHVY